MQTKRALFLLGLHNQVSRNRPNVPRLSRRPDVEDAERAIEDRGGLFGHVANKLRVRGERMQSVGGVEVVAEARANVRFYAGSLLQ